MKYLLLTLSILLLSSCWKLTPQEISEYTKYCESVWQEFRLIQMPFSDTYNCDDIYHPDKVQNCIADYIKTIDEKYNNPDIVSDLREDDYSKVVRTCQEVFGKAEIQ
jgi:hypothetical protein